MSPRSPSSAAPPPPSGRGHRLLWWALATELVALPLFGLIQGWPGVYAGFVLAAGAAAIVAWRRNEQARRGLDQSERHLRQISDNLPDPLWLATADGSRFLHTGPAAESIWGLSAEELAADPSLWLQGVHPDDREGAEAAFHRAVEERRLVEDEYRVVRPDGSIRWVRTRQFPITNGSGRVVRLAGIDSDITEARLAADAIAASEARYRQIVETTSEGILLLDTSLRISFANGRMAKLLGVSRVEIEGRGLWEFVDDRKRGALEIALEALDGEAREVELRRDDGTSFLARLSLTPSSTEFEGTSLLAMVEDVTREKRAREALRASERRYRHLARHDPLTGLPNRSTLLERLEGSLANDAGVAVLVIDLDDFKDLNDTRGHAAGDHALRIAAARIAGCLRSGDTVARMGGDEFAVLAGAGDEAEGARVAARVVAALGRTFRHGDSAIELTASVGLARGADSETPDDLIGAADLAMYAAKEAGGNRVERFEPAMVRRLAEDHRFEIELESCVEAGELRVEYQPIFELSTDRVMGVEALVRWQHPRRGLLAPGEFLELAERRGRIEEIGDWVLRRATTAISGWNSSLEDEPELILFANLSARELNSPALAGRVASALRASGLDPHHLVLEVTEDTVVEDAELSRDQLSELRSLGVRAAIDDFGAGYFSLAHLRSLPASVIKIDRSLIGSIDRRDSSILRSAVALAHTLALDAVVEGVETAEQLELARAIGCDLALGFLLARPMPWDGIECLLRARRGPATAPERPAAANGAEPSGSEIAKPLLPDPARLSAELAPFLGDGEARTARARTGVG